MILKRLSQPKYSMSIGSEQKLTRFTKPCGLATKKNMDDREWLLDSGEGGT
jgi:hypothetical protein